MTQHFNPAGDGFAPETEQQILGAVLANNDRYHEISGQIRDEHFRDPTHAAIWRNVSARIERDHLASPITLKEDLADHEGLKQLGGMAYLAKLITGSVSAFAIKDYANIVVEAHGRRSLAGRLEKLTRELRDGRSSDEVAAEMEMILHQREETSSEPRTMSFLKAQKLALEQMHEIKQGNLRGVPSGLKTLDDKVSLAPKRYTILGGATSMGKTALALHMVLSAARAGYGVGFVTLEMPEEDLANRINSAVSGIEYRGYDRPMGDASFGQVVNAAQDLQNLPLEVFSERVRDVPAILSEGKKLKRKWKETENFKGFKLLIIDYIQLVRGRGESQFVRLSQVANDLKQIAKQLDVHVIALAQIDRNLGKVDDFSEARPNLAHLRGSGDLENAPDNVMFIFRPEYYLTPPRFTVPKKPEDRADWEAEFLQWKGKAEIIIGKARMGEICSVKVGCDLSTNRFWDLDDGQEEIAF
ncbi:DnaB-like helicase C-terminal domain-containing protein [Pseudophaeobacter sp. EL27]|uniref:DnaB-like helicase C-terminal domain-containing protein n=1 Tax=Pseudophaeobacter sp. EL27 TaxID=2107580 RepID=UPI000EFD20C1|nr:DnaB-like helicase C-terminal domain-containing protein [Pseudophaeobacter sp. EL27]